MFPTPTTRRAITPHPRLVSASKIVSFLLCLMYLLTYIDRVNVSMASAVFDKQLKLDKTQVGFIFSAFAYPYLVFQVLGGYFGDHFGPRKVLTICSLVWAGATILTGLAGGFVSMIAARLLLGVGEGPTLPQYFKNQHHLDLGKTAIFSAGVFFAGVVGDTLGGMLSDHVYRKTGDLKKARRNLVVLFFLCSLACMVSLFFTEDLKLLAGSLSGAFFFAEMTIGPMWSIPMDIAPRYSGSASGMMNTGSALAAILSPVVFGAVIDKTHNWNLPFLGSMGLFLAGSIVAFWMKPEDAFKIAATPGEK